MKFQLPSEWWPTGGNGSSGVIGRGGRRYVLQDWATALCLNRQGILDSCLGGRLAIFVDIFGVETVVLFRRLEQICNFDLCQPGGLAIDLKVEPGDPIGGGMKDKFAHAEPPESWPFEVMITLMAENYLILIRDSSRKPDLCCAKS